MRQRSFIPSEKRINNFLLSFFVFTSILFPFKKESIPSPLPETQETFFQGFYSPIVIEENVLGAYLRINLSTQKKAKKTFGQLLKPKAVFNFSVLAKGGEKQTLSTSKKSYTIAMLGDSMIDTLAPDFFHLRRALKKHYPGPKFQILNYGAGGEDIESGLRRLTDETSYLGANRPSLLSLFPDIIVVESFAYNHWGGEKSDLDRQWLTLAKIVKTIKLTLPQTKIIIASTIAPNSKNFAQGAVGYSKEQSFIQAQTVKKYLENAILFAQSQNLPFADAYHPSLGPDGNGLLKYINQNDNLHPSGEGGKLFSQKIVEAILKNNLLK